MADVKTMTGTSSKHFDRLNLRHFLGLAVAFALLFALTTPRLGSSVYTPPESKIEMSGAWQTIDLDRYDRRSAIFSRSQDATLTAQLGTNRSISEVELRLYSYGEAENKIKIAVGDQVFDFQYGQKKGINRYTVDISPAVRADSIKISITELNQPAFLLDTLTVSGTGVQMERLASRVALGFLLGLALWIATQFTIAPSTSSGRIYTSIDGLRGIGVLLVLCLHATGYSGLPSFEGHPFLGRLSKHGHFGVEVFYVVSAYTLTFSLFSAVRREQLNLIGMFWARRINRILPTFMFVIFAAIVLQKYISGALPPGEDLPGLIWRYATMTYIFDRDVLRAALGHSVLWSISTEFQFYLLMPILMLPLIRRLSEGPTVKQLYFYAALLSVGSVLATAWTRILLAEKGWMPYTLFYHFDAFMIGIAVALFILAQRQTRRDTVTDTETITTGFKGKWGPELIALGALFGLVLLVAAATAGGRVFNIIGISEAIRPERLFVVLACAAAIIVSERAERMGAKLNLLKGLRTIGLLSFIIYLVHVPVLQIIGKIELPGMIGTEVDRYLTTLVLGLIVSLILSVGIHRLVEHPSAKLNSLAKTNPAYRIATSIFVLLIAACLLAYLGRS